MGTFLVWSRFQFLVLLFPLYSTASSEHVGVVVQQQKRLEDIRLASRNETSCEDNTFNLPSFKCPDGTKCLLPHAVCNGIKDCQRGEDESNCPHLCPIGMTQCTSNTVCIPAELNCDGKNDCHDGSDEQYCPSRMSIPWFWIGLAVLFLICILVFITVGKNWCTKKNNRRRRPPPRPRPVQTVKTTKKNHSNVQIPDANNVTTVLVREE